MESNYTKIPPKGSKYTVALKNMAKIFIKIYILIWSKKFQYLIQFLEIQLINITSSTESTNSGMVDNKILMIRYEMTPLRHFY